MEEKKCKKFLFNTQNLMPACQPHNQLENCVIVHFCLRFKLLTRSSTGLLTWGRQGVTVVSDHRSMVLTYIAVGPVDSVYYIRHK